MADLEDKILKTNIPGKYTWWQKDDDEEGPKARSDWIDPDASDEEAEMTEVERQRKFVETGVPEPVRRSIMAGEAERQRAHASRTGVKGVLNDYQNWAELQDAQQQLEEEYKQAMYKRMVEGAKRDPSAPPPQGVSKANQDEDGANDDEDDDDDEDAFLQEYRAARLSEMKATSGRPQYGEIREVTRSEFVSAVDLTDPRSFVVVHLYEPYIKACQRMNRFLELLAKEYPFVKFLRMQSTAAGGDYDPIALPTLMIYKAKAVVQVIPRVSDELGGDAFTKEDVQWLLQEQNVFDGVKVPSGSGSGGAAYGPSLLSEQAAGGEAGDYDGDDDGEG